MKFRIQKGGNQNFKFGVGEKRGGTQIFQKSKGGTRLSPTVNIKTVNAELIKLHRECESPDIYHKEMSRKLMPELWAKVHYNQQLLLGFCDLHLLLFKFYAGVIVEVFVISLIYLFLIEIEGLKVYPH